MAEDKKGSNKDRELGLEAGEFQDLEARHQSKLSTPGVTGAETGINRESTKTKLGGAVRWDEKTAVKLSHFEGEGDFSILEASRIKSNLRFPLALPLCFTSALVLGFVFFTQAGLADARLALTLLVILPLVFLGVMFGKGADSGCFMPSLLTGFISLMIGGYLFMNFKMYPHETENSKPWVYVPAGVAPQKAKSKGQQEDMKKQLDRENALLRKQLQKMNAEKGQ